MTSNDNLEKVVASVVYGFTRAMVSAGMSPNDALRLAAFSMIESELGRDATEGALGVPAPTARRWRRQIAELSVDDLPDDLELDVMNELLSAEGFPDLRVMRRDKGVNDDGEQKSV